MKLSKKDFIKMVADSRTPIGNRVFTHEQAEYIYHRLPTIILNILESGDEIRLPDLGKFSVVDVPERMCTNPNNGKKITVPAKKKIVFTPCELARKTVNHE